MGNGDRCYECTGYGDDYIWDAETGEYVIACQDCPYNRNEDDDEEREGKKILLVQQIMKF